MKYLSYAVRRPGIVFGVVAIALASAASLSAMRSDAEVLDAPSPAPLVPTIKYVEKTASVAKGGYKVIDVPCPTGFVAIASGYASSVGSVMGIANYPSLSHHAWVAGISNVFPQVRIASTLTGYAVCAKSGVRMVAPEPGS